MYFSVHTRTPSLCLFQASPASLLPSRLTVLIITFLKLLAFLASVPPCARRLCRLEFYSSCRFSTLLRGFIRFRIKSFEKIFGILGILEILGIEVHFRGGEHNVKCVCISFFFFEMLAGITFSVHSFWGEN